MLPRKLHLEQINRFHDLVQKISDQIDVEQDNDKRFELAGIYFRLTSTTWCKIDDHVESLKNELDNLLRGTTIN